MDYNVIAVDFDGTLCTNKYPNIGEPNNFVIDYILQKKNAGDKIILWTCRTGVLLEEAVNWCEKHGIAFDAVNDNVPELVDLFHGSNTRKIFADEYIDDKSISVEDVECEKRKYFRQAILELPASEPSNSFKMVCCVGAAVVIAVILLYSALFGLYRNLSDKIDTIAPKEETVREVYIYLEPEKAAADYEIADEVLVTERIDIVEPQEINEDFDILQPCGYSKEQLLYSVSDEYRSEMVPYIDTLLQAEKTYGVNALYLMCKIGLESGWCRYPSGENNLGGWTNSDGTYMDFDSGEDCIMHIAERLSTDYACTTGTRLADVCVRYCPYDGYSESLMDIMKDRKEKIESM